MSNAKTANIIEKLTNRCSVQFGVPTASFPAFNPPSHVPRLDERLRIVAHQIRCHTHVDIGSDHGHLLKALLSSGRIERGIAIENKSAPFANSTGTLAGLGAEVRLADGLAGLADNEADCLSVCGMGGASIARILDAHPDRVPEIVILQPNGKPERVRRWGLLNNYDLIDETNARARPRYVVLRFERRAMHRSTDPAYEGIQRDAALLFGPHRIRRRSKGFLDSLDEELAYFHSLKRMSAETADRCAVIQRVLNRF